MDDYETYKRVLSNQKLPHYIVDLGEGFLTRTRNPDCLEKHGLLEKGVLGFVNDLCLLVDEHKDTLPKGEWEVLEETLRSFMVKHSGGELYYYLLHAHGPDAINHNAWVHFSSDTDWNICVRTFTDMPTAVLEEYAVKDWTARTKRMQSKDRDVFLTAIGKRTDIYGEESLPKQMVAAVLFNE